MSNTIKCKMCNIVIDEMLAYIQNKISVSDEGTLVRLCISAFTGDEIQKSKSLLFEAIPNIKRKIQRKSEGKEQRDLHDIIDLFKTAEPDIIPVFVARQLEKLPPITFDHLDCTKLLRDIVRLQSDVDGMKTSYATLSHFEELKKEIQSIKHSTLPRLMFDNINTSCCGGCCLDSGPIGLSQPHNRNCQREVCPMNDNEESELIEKNNGDSHVAMSANVLTKQPLPPTSLPSNSTPVVRNIQLNVEDCSQSMLIPKDKCKVSQQIGNINSNYDTPDNNLIDNNENSVIATPLKCQHVVVVNNGVCLQNIPSAQLSNKQNNTVDEEWHVVRKKQKSKYRYSGQVGKAVETLSTNFKAAARKIPMFITNIHLTAEEMDIVNYIKNKTKETVKLEKIIMKKETNHKAYKFFINSEKLPLFMNEDIWPERIIFRRFVHFKHRMTTNSSDDTQKSVHG